MGGGIGKLSQTFWQPIGKILKPIAMPIEKLSGKYCIPILRGKGGVVVTHRPPTSEVGSSNHGPCVEKLVVAS